MRKFLSLALLLGFLPGLAGAATIEVSWTGTVDLVAPDLASVLEIGDPASGSFQIDTAIADTDADPMIGWYPGAASNLSFRFGVHELSAAAGALRILNSLGDGLIVTVQSLGGAIDAVPVNYLSFSIESGPGPFSSDAIPLNIDSAQFQGRAMIGGDFLGSPTLAAASASSFAYAVPEPGTGMLIGLGLLLLVGLRSGSHHSWICSAR
jgi:hypothetical protein